MNELADIKCNTARDMSVKVAISTDAHSMTDYALMRFGVDQARRGWLSADDVINTKNLKEMKEALKRR